MTEEDTFKILKRIPFDVIKGEWAESPLSCWGEEGTRWFKDRGWNKEEWYNEYDRRRYLP